MSAQKAPRTEAPQFPTTRAGVLSAALLQAEHWWFLTEMAEYLRATPSSLQHKLESPFRAGLL